LAPLPRRPPVPPETPPRPTRARRMRPLQPGARCSPSVSRLAFLSPPHWRRAAGQRSQQRRGALPADHAADLIETGLRELERRSPEFVLDVGASPCLDE